MNTLIRKVMLGVALLATTAAGSLAGSWTANISSNQSYSGTAVVPSTAMEPYYTQSMACYLGQTICDGPAGDWTITYPAQPDDKYADDVPCSAGSYPVYLYQTGSGYANVDFSWM
jgi:hypothetical protein